MFPSGQGRQVSIFNPIDVFLSPNNLSNNTLLYKEFIYLYIFHTKNMPIISSVRAVAQVACRQIAQNQGRRQIECRRRGLGLIRRLTTTIHTSVVPTTTVIGRTCQYHQQKYSFASVSTASTTTTSSRRHTRRAHVTTTTSTAQSFAVPATVTAEATNDSKWIMPALALLHEHEQAQKKQQEQEQEQEHKQQVQIEYSHGGQVLSANKLTTQVLNELFTNQVCVVRVPEFVVPELRSKLLQYLTEDAEREPYTHEVYDTVVDEETGEESKVARQVYLGVDRVGVPFNSIYGHDWESQVTQHYFNSAEPMMQAMRDACAPYSTPTDTLRSLFSSLKPTGRKAEIASINGRTMFCGIGRIMNATLSGRSEEIHFDALPPKYIDVVQQFAANFYLRVPDCNGGELRIWDREPMRYDEIAGADEDDAKAWADELGEPISLRPDAGDLLLFNTRRPHAIGAFTKGGRTQVQTFIGLKKEQSEPIIMWN
jgi:hypothetical protein